MRFLFAVLGLMLMAHSATSQAPTDELLRKQMVMLAAEAEFFSALAVQRQVEIDRLKAAPCGEAK